MKNNPKCSIIVRTRNHKRLLENLLKEIKKQKKISKPEIVVVDSSSTDGTREVAEKEGCKIVSLDPKDFGHSYTLNLGAKNSKNEILAYVSVDIIPKDDFWLFNLIKHFVNKKIAGVFGKQEPIPNFNTIEEFKTKKMFSDDGKTVALFSCASGAIRKSVWKKIKYNEKMPYKLMGGQDQTWVLEAEKLGYRIIYEPKSIVYHSHKYSAKSRIRSAYTIGFYQKEVDEFNKKVKILNYKKIDLIKYLIKKKKFKELIWDLIIIGIAMRVAALYGKINRKISNQTTFK